MGSVVISEIAHETSRYPWMTMSAGSAPQSGQDAYTTPATSSFRRQRSPLSQKILPSSQQPPCISVTSHEHSSTAREADVTPLCPIAPEQGGTPKPALEIPRKATVPPRSPRLSPAHDAVTLSIPPRPPVGDSTSSVSCSTQPPSPASLRSTKSASTSPPRIKVRDLQHIHSFISDDLSTPDLLRHLSYESNDRTAMAPQYEISAMPVSDIIEMVAGLITKITTTNDRQHDYLHRQIQSTDGTVGMSPRTSSILAFHGKNAPTITILSYLSRIHKYCPTTYEVFLSLLVYFDRITEQVNSMPMQTLREADQHSLEQDSVLDSNGAQSSAESHKTTSVSESALHDPKIKPPQRTLPTQELPSPPLSESAYIGAYSLSHFFVLDSFNVHRLVIAGVTCASKFFSDVFYTNSRYAKVGGLPLGELNNLELQFLLLNDFRLSITVEELEAYGTMLVEFYAREIVAQKTLKADAMEGVEVAA